MSRLTQKVRAIFDRRGQGLNHSILKDILQVRGELREESAEILLRDRTSALKERFDAGETPQEIMIEAYAICSEAVRRILGIEVREVQLLGAVALAEGAVAEMRTGEGKTVTAAFPAYLFALQGHCVHVVTTNEYLAKRDCEMLSGVFQELGLSVGVLLHEMPSAARRQQYACDIVYGTHAEFGFDYLRDNLVVHVKDRVQRGLDAAVVDEADSILIDDARTPLLITDEAAEGSSYLYHIDDLVSVLNEDRHIEVDYSQRTASLTDEGIDAAEQIFCVQNILARDNEELYGRIVQALRARHVMQRDKDYVVQRGLSGKEEIILIDAGTGRLMFGRRFMDGLHEAIEAKERVAVQAATGIQGMITLQHFFRMYRVLCGMTGTGKEARDEFAECYGRDVVQIPTYRPVIRQDLGDRLFVSEEAKLSAIMQDIAERHTRGQPVLVGTSGVRESELLSRLLMEQQGIAHNVLNAKNAEREAVIIAGAGQLRAVTISTNMAGRGIDILLGEGVLERGGLHVIGTTRYESERIDNQLRGRSGRQGDVGSSQFYLSFEDELLQLYGSDYAFELLDSFQDESGDVEIKLSSLRKAVHDAQRKVEAELFAVRKRLLRLEEGLDVQRKHVYNIRDKLLEKTQPDDEPLLQEMIQRVIDRIVDVSWPQEREDIGESVNLLELIVKLDSQFPSTSELVLTSLPEVDRQQLKESMYTHYWNEYLEWTGGPSQAQFVMEKTVYLKMIDTHWVLYLEAAQETRQGIHYRLYGNEDPVYEYIKETSLMFTNVWEEIERDTVRMLWRQCCRQRNVSANHILKETIYGVRV